MAKFEAAAVAAEELYWHDEVSRFRGTRAYAATEEYLVSPIVDESVDIVSQCEAAKQLLGREVALGFADVTHVMKFIVGKTAAPEPVKNDPEGGMRVLVAA